MNGAHLHLVLNHIPVIGAVAVTALLAYAVWVKNLEVTKLTLRVAVLIGALSLPVFLSGEPAEEVVEHLAGIIESNIEKHEDFSVYALITTELVALIAIYGLWRLRRGGQLSSGFLLVIGFAAAINLAFMLYTANLGGKIRHSEIQNSFIYRISNREMS